MKRLVTTTAVALIMAAPVAAQTQTDTQTGNQTGTQMTTTTTQTMPAGGGSGFLQSLQQGDMLASNLMDAQIYARTSDAPQQTGTTNVDDGQTMEEADDTGLAGAAESVEQTAETAAQATGQAISQAGRAMTPQDMQGMENIGSVDDLVLDQQGKIRGVLVDIGGFLGIGSRQVALDMSELQISTDPQDPRQIYIVSMVDRTTLENAPEFDEMQGDMMNADTNPNNLSNTQAVATTAGSGADWRQDREMMTAPTVQREGYQPVEASEMSADNLMGANVYDANDQDVGNIDDVVLGQDGSVEYAVIDVGGFLGIGTRTVAIGFDEMTVMQNQDMSDLRVYVDVTEQSLESMPEYEGQ